VPRHLSPSDCPCLRFGPPADHVRVINDVLYYFVLRDWWGSGLIICLERGADLHMAQLMPLPLTVSCFSKIQIGFTFLVPAGPGSPGKRAVKRVCVCACVRACVCVCVLLNLACCI